MTWDVGDSVLMVANDERWLATVHAASRDQKALGLTFDGHVCGHAGFMPILLDDDGIYRSIIDPSVAVELRPWVGFGYGSSADLPD